MPYSTTSRKPYDVTLPCVKRTGLESPRSFYCFMLWGYWVPEHRPSESDSLLFSKTPSNILPLLSVWGTFVRGSYTLGLVATLRRFFDTITFLIQQRNRALKTLHHGSSETEYIKFQLRVWVVHQSLYQMLVPGHYR